MLKSLKKSVRLSLSDSSSYEKKEKKEPTKSASFSMRNLELTVKYMGYLPVSDARSLQTLKHAIRFVVQQRIRRTHSRFEMKNFQVIIYDLESEETILDIPIQKVALCGKEFVKGFEKCFAVNVTTDDTHVCHVMQAATTYEAEKFLAKIADAFEALGKMAKKTKQRKSVPTATSTSKSPGGIDEVNRSDDSSISRGRPTSGRLTVDSSIGVLGQSADGHDGLPSSMGSRQLPPIPTSYNYDKTETGPPHSPDDGHEMQIRPLPPVPPTTGSDEGSFNEEDPYVRLKKTKNDITSEDPYSTIKSKSVVEDPYSTVKSKSAVEDPYSTVKSKSVVEDPYSTVKSKSVVEDPYSSVKSNRVEEDPYSTVKSKYTEDPYSKVKGSVNEEDPYSSIKDIRKSKPGMNMNQAGQPSNITKGIHQYKTENEEDPYSTVCAKSDSKSNIVIRVSSPAAVQKLSTPVDDSNSIMTDKSQVDDTTDEAKRTAPMAEFKANITPDLYAARKLYQSRRSITNQWTSYNVSEVFEEVGGDDKSNGKSKKKIYDATDIYVNLHKYRLQNSNKSAPSNQSVNRTSETEDTLYKDIKQEKVDNSNQSQIDGKLAVNQHKFYQSIKDAKDSYQKLKSKIKSNVSKQHNQQPFHLDTNEAVRRIVSEIYKYDYRLDNSEKLQEVMNAASINIDSIDPETGYSLLHHSISSESLSSTKFFLNRGANVNILNKDKSTPLHFAVTTENFSIVKLLLCHGADVTIKDIQGRTALHMVTGLQLDRKMMILLVEYGARINEADSSGTRPVDIEPELRNIQREMILKSNDELCTIDVGVIFRIRSRVNSKSSVGSGTGSIKSIESKSNLSTTNEDIKPRLVGIDEKAIENHDDLLMSPEREDFVMDQPVSDNLMEDSKSYEDDEIDSVADISDTNSTTLPIPLKLEKENIIHENNLLKDQCENEILTTSNESTRKNKNIDITNSDEISSGKPDTTLDTTKTDQQPISLGECPNLHELKSDTKHQKNEDSLMPIVTDNKDITAINQNNDTLDVSDNQDSNEFTSDMDAWGSVFSELDAWDDVFVETESATPDNQQDIKPLDSPNTAKKNLSLRTNGPELLSREDIISNKISNEELLQAIESINSPIGDPKIDPIFPGDPALEDFDSKDLLGQEEKAAKNLRSLAILSKNPECHPIILSLLFAPNVALKNDKTRSSPRTLSVQLTALAHTECAVKSLHRYLASFIFMLCQADGTTSQKKSINSGIVNLLSDLLDSKDDLIKRTSLSLIWQLLHIEYDREFYTVVSHFHVEPLLDLIFQYEEHGDIRVDQFNRDAIDDMYRQYVLKSRTMKNNEIIIMASKILARASIFAKVRKNLSHAKVIALLCTSHALLAPQESYLLGCTIANIAMNADNHALLEEYHMTYALKPLLASKDPLMQYHAARCLVYMGYHDLNIYIFSHDYEEMLGDVIYANDPDSEHKYIRGTTLERIIEMLTGNSSALWGGSSLTRSSSNDTRDSNFADDKHSTTLTSEQTLEFILTMYSTFTSPIIFMNLLLHRFRHPCASRIFGWNMKSTSSPIEDENPMEMYSPLPLVHVYLMRVWEMWLESFSDDFVADYDLAISLQKLIQPMKFAGGPYRPSAARLEELLSKIKTRKLTSSSLDGTNSFEAVHNKLYEKCKFDIACGTQPCNFEEAAKLASIQLYIEDITGTIEENHDNYSLGFLKPKKPILINNPDQDLVISRASTSRIKYCLPNVFSKSKLAIKMVKEIHEDLCIDNPSERNAKHSYIEYCQSLPTYGCCVFNLEEVIVVSNSKHKRPKAEYEKRLLCIHPKHVLILDNKTREKIAYYNFQTLKRWEPGNFGHVTTMQLTFSSKAHTFLLEDQSQWQEIDQVFWACIEELDWQRISKMSKTPWSKLAEETHTWGRAAAAAHARTITVQAAAKLSSSIATAEDLENYHNVAEMRAKTTSQGGSLSSLGSGSVTLRRSSTTKQFSNGSSHSSGKEVDDRLRSAPLRRRSQQEHEGGGIPLKPPSDTPKWRMKQVWALSQMGNTKRQVSRDSINSDVSLDESWVYVEKHSSSSGDSAQTPNTPLDDQLNIWYRRNHPSSPDSRAKKSQAIRTSPSLPHRDRYQSTGIPREDSNTSINNPQFDSKSINDDSNRSTMVTSSPTDSYVDLSLPTEEMNSQIESKLRSISRASTSSSIAESFTTTDTRRLPRNATFGSLESELTYSNSYKSTEGSLAKRDMVKPAGVKSIESYGILLDFPKCYCPADPDLPELDLESISNADLLRYPRELAKQITLIDHGLFRKVSVEDCHKKFSGESKKRKQFDESNAIQAFAERFNKLSQWVTASVLQEKDMEVRARVLGQFILTAKYCLQFGNYNAVMAIVVAGLGSSPIRRLEKTRALVSKEILADYDEMEILMDPKKNYKAYRHIIKTAPIPAVPYFGIYLKDLTFATDGNPDCLRGGLINLAKRRYMYVVLEEMKRFQKEKYLFQEIPEIQRYLCDVKKYSDEGLYKMSMEVE